MSFIYRWLSEFFNYPIINFYKLFFVFIFFIFFVFIYRKNLKTFFSLLIAVVFFSWPGIVAYPNPRYISVVYPFLIFMFIYGIYLFSKEVINKYIKIISTIIFLIIAFLSIKKGILENIKGIKKNAKNTLIYKSKFEKFFKENKFNKNVNFIIFGVPFVSDVKYVFQVFLGNFSIEVAHIRHSTLACKGSMGCRQDYRIKAVESKIASVKQGGKIGFRLTSLDEEHCGWWMNFSHFPLKWSEQERAYVWNDKQLEVGKWHNYSMGRFKIHKRLPTKQILDITFLIDAKWINKNTIFVTWDTVNGKYKTIKL